MTNAPKSSNYPPPVDKLLTYGDAHFFSVWPDYLELGLTAEHIPDLIRMVTDPALNWGDELDLDIFAPVHAWRALGQLRAEEAIAPLMTLFDEFADDEGSDWVGEELPEVFGMIGTAAMLPLLDMLADDTRRTWQRMAAAESLELIAASNPQVRSDVVNTLTRQLERFAENDPSFNGALILSLVALKAADALPLIEQAYGAQAVDEDVAGELEDARGELTLKDAPDASS
jgi:hypothetical protein